MKLIYMLILSLLLIILSSNIGESYLGYFKMGECVPIVNNLNATSVNITEITTPSPNSAIVVRNTPMNKTGGSFNYSFCNTQKIGSYNYGFIDNNGNQYSNNFDITPNGFNNSLGFYIVLLVIVTLVVALGFAIKELWFVVIGGMALIMLGIYSINNGIVDMKDMFMTWGIGLFEIGVGTILSVGAAWQKSEED